MHVVDLHVVVAVYMKLDHANTTHFSTIAKNTLLTNSLCNV